jgi:hypothetical protein
MPSFVISVTVNFQLIDGMLMMIAGWQQTDRGPI